MHCLSPADNSLQAPLPGCCCCCCMCDAAAALHCVPAACRYVSPEEWGREDYPTYAIGAAGYVLSIDLAREVAAGMQVCHVAGWGCQRCGSDCITTCISFPGLFKAPQGCSSWAHQLIKRAVHVLCCAYLSACQSSKQGMLPLTHCAAAHASPAAGDAAAHPCTAAHPMSSWLSL